MEDQAEHNNEDGYDEYDEEEDDETRLERIKDTWNPLLLKSSQKGDMDGINRALEKGAQIETEDKKRWNSLLWATCKGYIDIVRLLLSNGAGQFYSINHMNPLDMTNSSTNARSSKIGSSEDAKPKVQLGVINNNAANTPLMWACNKGFYKIVWLLLREGLDWKETDSFGNNCVHMAASSNSLITLEAMLEWGVTTYAKNTRGHHAIDLTTEEPMILLLKNFAKTKVCEVTKRPFGEEDTKYLCHFCKNYYSKEGVKHYMMFETDKDEIKERPECRCTNCDKLVHDTEKKIDETIKGQEE